MTGTNKAAIDKGAGARLEGGTPVSASDREKASVWGREQLKLERSKAREISRELDKALEATFPASDPFAIGQPTVTAVGRSDRRPAVVDGRLVEMLAREVADRRRG